MQREPASSRMSASEGKISLFLGDIDLSLDDTGLGAICSPFGTVIAAKVQRSKLTHKSLGYGFVTMTTAEEAQLCIDKLDGVIVGDKPIRVSWAERNRTLLVCNLNPETSREQIMMYFESYGAIERDSCTEGTRDSIRYIVVSFTKRPNAERCRVALNGLIFDGFQLLVSWYQPMLLDRVLAMKPGSSASPGSSLGYVSNTQWRQSQEGDVHQTPAGTSPRSINHLICALSDDDSRYEAGQTSPRSMDSSHMQVAAAGGVSPGASASSEKRLGGLGTATSIYVKFESYVKSIAINEAVFHEIFSPFGTITEVTLKKLLTDQITGRRHGYAFVHFTSDEVGRAAAIAAVQATQLGINAFGISLTTEVSKTLHRQIQQRYALQPQVRMREITEIPSATALAPIPYHISPQPSYIAHGYVSPSGPPHYVYATMPPGSGAPSIPVYGMIAPSFNYWNVQPHSS